MTIQVKIGEYEKEMAEIRPDWITEQLNRRRRQGEPVCIRVTIHQGPLNLQLATSDCPSLGGQGAALNSEERQVWELWKRLHLNEKEFTAGNLIAFLQQISH